MKNILHIIFFILVLWIAMSSMIQRFKCDSLTETQLFKLLPNNFVFDWKECE